MKKYLSMAALVAGLQAPAQVFVGSEEALSLAPGSTLTFDGLSLSPSAGLTLSNHTLTRSATPVTGTDGSASIQRVYYFNNPLLYNGAIHFQYLDAELNGNTEGSLQLYRRHSNVWSSPAATTVNTAANYADADFSNISFDALTLSKPGAVLPLLTNSLQARWQTNFVNVEWVILQNEIYRSFVIEASTDGSAWQTIGELQAQSVPGKIAYQYPDRNTNFEKKQYRIKLVALSGKEYYSTIVSVSNSGKKDLTVVTSRGGARFYFSTPVQNLMLFNSKGQLIRRSSVTGMQAEVNGLTPGVYIVVAAIRGESLQKTFVLPE